MHDALEVAQAACEKRPKDAEGWWLLGRINLYTDLPAASEDAFRRASLLNRRHRPPFRIGTAEFAQLLDGVRKEISPDAKRRLEGSEVRVEPLPSIEVVRSGIGPDSLCWRSRAPNDVLVIYQTNLENRSATQADLRGLLVRTLSRA